MVCRTRVPEARTVAHFVKQIRGIGHTFHPACHHCIRLSECNLIESHHRRFHAGTAHLVQRGCGHLFTQTRVKARLSGRCLTLTGRKNASHQNFVNRNISRLVPCRAYRNASKLRSRHPGQHPLKTAHRRACCTGYHNFTHFFVLPGAASMNL